MVITLLIRIPTMSYGYKSIQHYELIIIVTGLMKLRLITMCVQLRVNRCIDNTCTETKINHFFIIFS